MGQIHQQLAHLLHPFGVQAVEGLVQQQHIGLSHQCQRQAQPLLHAHRIAPGPIVAPVLQAHCKKRRGRGRLRIGVSLGDGAHHDVLHPRERGIHGRALYQAPEPRAGAAGPHGLAPHLHRARCGRQITRQYLEQC